AYCNIFTRLGLNFRPVQADTGSIGGTGSHEFHVLAESGEDAIAFSDSSDYAANIEKAEAIPREKERGAATEEMRLVDTPDAKTIAELVERYQLPIEKTVKTLVVHAAEEGKLDRKSTRLNSSHVKISYAVFCLKKKIQTQIR